MTTKSRDTRKACCFPSTFLLTFELTYLLTYWKLKYLHVTAYIGDESLSSVVNVLISRQARPDNLLHQSATFALISGHINNLADVQRFLIFRSLSRLICEWWWNDRCFSTFGLYGGNCRTFAEHYTTSLCSPNAVDVYVAYRRCTSYRVYSFILLTPSAFFTFSLLYDFRMHLYETGWS